MTARASETGERRHLMVDEQLVRRGIRDEDVLAAMRSSAVPTSRALPRPVTASSMPWPMASVAWRVSP